MVKYEYKAIIEETDWSEYVSNVYGRPYRLQQQDGCMDRGIRHITVPSNYTNDEFMNDDIPEEVNGEMMGVKFSTWLNRNPNETIWSNYRDELFWHRNFYPDLDTVINDLHSKGLLEAGNYIINIDW